MTQQYQIPADVVSESILSHFGQQPQQIKCLEELAECGARIAKDIAEKHSPQNSSSYDKTVEEIADATIMLRQMRLLYGWQGVDQAIARKLERTQRYIERMHAGQDSEVKHD